jgi:hypothetical protein
MKMGTVIIGNLANKKIEKNKSEATEPTAAKIIVKRITVSLSIALSCRLEIKG